MLSLASKIEAVLYLKGQPMSIPEIAETAQCDRNQVKDAILELMSNYAHRDTALEIIETTKGYSLQLKEAYSHLMETLIPPELGVGALRTLAAIALKKGIAQTELVELRGSGAYQHVQELVELGFVRKRRQPESRSYWLQVTDKFFQYFQLDQLPQQLSLNLRELAKEDDDEKQPETSGETPTESPAETEIEASETSGEAASETPTEVSSGDSSDNN